MALSLKDFVAEHPVDRERVDAHKERMLAETRAYRLRELREDAGLTQAQLAARIGVGQRQVSKIEHGDLDNAKVGTIRNYLEARCIPPGNRLEPLNEDRVGQHSIRVNAQWRLCFVWRDGGADDVELVDDR